MRFNNDISGPAFTSGQPPCNAGGRTGRPIAVHLHGSASLAPYDGWADDVICTGEAKEYVSSVQLSSVCFAWAASYLHVDRIGSSHG